MRKVLLTTLMAIFAVTAFSQKAQKADLDRYFAKLKYRALPTKPQNPEYTTYSINLSASATVRNNHGENEIQDRINIAGWKKVSGTKGHIIVQINLNELMIASSKIEERIEPIKDKDGKETGKKYFYKAVASYTWDGNANVRDYKESTLGSYGFGSTSTAKSWASSEYSTRKEAYDYYENNKYAIRDQLVKSEVRTAISQLASDLNFEFGYPDREDSDQYWMLNSKKHTETQNQQDVWASIKKAVESITADNIPAEAVEVLTGAIKYFDEIPAKFPTDDKNDKKMRYGSYYNKAKIYITLENLDAAIKEAESLIANDYDAADGKRLKKEAEDLKEVFAKNNKTTRHFSIDLSNATPPASN